MCDTAFMSQNSDCYLISPYSTVEVGELLTEAAVGVPHRWPASTDRSSLNIWKYVIFKIIHKVKSEATELTINGHCVRLEAKKVIKKINIFCGVFTCCELEFLRVKDMLRWLVSLLLSLDRRDVSGLVETKDMWYRAIVCGAEGKQDLGRRCRHVERIR